jgi:CARDB protein
MFIKGGFIPFISFYFLGYGSKFFTYLICLIRLGGFIIKKFIIFSFGVLLILLLMGSVSAAETNKSSTKNSNNFLNLTVDHDTVKPGTNVIFNLTVKNANGSAVSGARVNVLIRAVSDNFTVRNKSNSNSYVTDKNGRYSFNWNTTDNYDFGKYELIIDVFGDSNATYTEYLDLTVVPTMKLDVSKKTIYEGEFTSIRASVNVYGKKGMGYIQWIYSNGKSVLTLLNSQGVSVFQYNSYDIGSNIIGIRYIPFDIPGFSGIPGVESTVLLTVKGNPDLVIYKIKKYGSKKYKITIKNIGNGSSGAFKLKLGYSKKYKIVTVPSIGKGKLKTVIVNFFNYKTHKKYKKVASINYNKGVYEKNYNNNKAVFKSNTYYGLLPDIKVVKVSRSGNNILVTVKNQGNYSSPIFKILLWYGSKNKGKGYSDYIANFGSFGKYLPPGSSVTMKIPYISYKKHSKYYKYILLNYNKKFLEFNYNNNFKKFKV